MVSKYYFKAYFVEKQAKKIISIFDQSDGLTPLRNICIGRLGKMHIFQSRKACFLTGLSANIISRPILLKTKQRGKFRFLTKVMG